MIKKILVRLVIVLITMILFLVVYVYVYAKKARVISEGSPIEKYEKGNFALLVIDIQESTTGQVSTNEYYKAHSEELIQRINDIIVKFEAEQAPVIYVQNQVTDAIINLLDNTYAEGSEGAKLDKRLNVVSDHFVSKSRQDAFSNPELDKILIEHKVNKIYIVGLDAAYCVYSTIQAAQNRNYKILVIDEAVISDSDAKREDFITQYQSSGVEVLSFRNILPIN